MDIQAYIASGIIESYVLGITSPEETAEVRELAEQYPEIRAEIEAIHTSLEAYIMQYEQMPPESLKDKIWHKLAQLEGENTIKSAYPANEREISSATYRIDRVTSEKNRFKNYLVAASITGLILSLGFNVYMYTELNQTKQKLAEATIANSQLAQDLKINQANYAETTEALAILRNPDNKEIYLKGLEIAPEAAVVVYWNNKKQDVHLDVYNLPAPTAGKQYQLWAIVDGKPVDAGMLNSDGSVAGLQKMKDIGKADAFAITLEKTGGSTAPEGDMYVLGEVPKQNPSS